MLEYQVLNKEIRRLVLDTMKDGDKAFQAPKVYEALKHNLHDHRYVPECLASISNGYGDITLRIRVGHAIFDINVSGNTKCVYYERDEDYCWKPKWKEHADVVVKFVKWVF